MALHRPNLLLLVAAILPLVAAAASRNQLPPEPTTSAPLRHHPSPATASTATGHFHPVPSEEAMTGKFGPAQATTTTPPPDLTSEAHPQQQEASASEGSASSAPTLALTTATATTTRPPLPDQRTAAASAGSPPPIIQAAVAKAVALGSEEGLLPLARALAALGYTEMASAAELYPNLAPLARWHGPITVFAVPDVSLERCSTCSRRRILLEHIALGYYPYSELAASPTIKIPSASLNLCLNIATVRGTFSVHYARLFVEGVEISHPEVYNDGRYIVHGLRTVLEPLSQYSCFDRSHSRHCHDDYVPTRSGDNMPLPPARSDATSVSMSAMRVSIRIREAISRLRGGG